MNTSRRIELFQGAAIVLLAHLYGVPIPLAAVGALVDKWTGSKVDSRASES